MESRRREEERHEQALGCTSQPRSHLLARLVGQAGQCRAHEKSPKRTVQSHEFCGVHHQEQRPQQQAQ